jgi:hypothetical protein
MENIREHGDPPENLTIRYNFFDGELPIEPIAAMAGKTGGAGFKRKRVVRGSGERDTGAGIGMG